MKKFIIAVLSLLTLAAGCKRDQYLTYSDINRIQMNDTSTMSETFVYDQASVTKDTVYIQVNTIGQLSNQDRPVKLQQIQEYTTSYTLDPTTGQVVDSVVSAVPYTAVPGVHYVPFDDPSLVPLMVVKADSVTAMIPVVLLRDTSLKTNSYRLRVQLEANDAFGLGEDGAREKTIVFSDHLERFYSWRVDNYTATAYLYFGNYSIAKHQFMIDVLHTVIDENWFQAALAAGELQEYKVLLEQALTAYNNDPANIADGKAPLRESSDPNSPVVTFP